MTCIFLWNMSVNNLRRLQASSLKAEDITLVGNVTCLFLESHDPLQRLRLYLHLQVIWLSRSRPHVEFTGARATTISCILRLLFLIEFSLVFSIGGPYHGCRLKLPKGQTLFWTIMFSTPRR